MTVKNKTLKQNIRRQTKHSKIIISLKDFI
jgi:hypothetical protein